MTSPSWAGMQTQLWPILIPFSVHQKRPGLFPGDVRPHLGGGRESKSLSTGGVKAKQEKKQEPEVWSYAIVSSQTADEGEGVGYKHS